MGIFVPHIVAVLEGLGGMPLLKEVCPCGQALKFLESNAILNNLSLLSICGWKYEFSNTVPAAHHCSTIIDSKLCGPVNTK